RSIVHCAVVDSVTVDRLANSQMIKVSGEHYVFIFQSGIASWKLRDEIGRLHIFLSDCCPRLDAYCQREARQRFAVFEQVQNFLQRMAGTLKQLARLRGIEY